MSEWKTEVGNETIYRTCAWSPPGCHPVGCGLKVHVEDGKVTKVEGDPEHPITKGALCPRCLAMTEYLYHPDRIIYPMKRAKEDRGKDKWEQISWDEAIDIVTGEAKRIIDSYGAEAIMVFGGTGREGNSYYRPLANLVYGSPNSCYAQSGWSCYGPRIAVTAFLLGGGYPEIDYAQKFYDRYDHEGWVAPEAILCWGKAPLESNADGLWGHAFIDLMKDHGTKLIVVDPRMTWLGTRAEYVLQVRPGTDTALAMAFLNVIISEDLYDHDFVEKWTYGFDQLAERVATMPPSKAAEICGVPEKDIVAAARLYGKAKPSSLAWGLAVDQNPNGVQLGQCLCALMTITGFIDAPGGTTLGSIENFPNAAADPAQEAMRHGFMTEETWSKRIGLQEFPAVTTIIPTVHPDSMLDTLETDQPYKMRMAHIASSNPIGGAISSCPQRWADALRKLEFNVVTDLFMTPTAMEVCDVFLPLASCLEHDAVVATHYGWNTSFYGAVNNIIEVGETKSEADIMVLIGKRLYPQFWNQFNNGNDYDTWYGLRFGYTPEELREKIVVMTEEPYYKYRDGLIRRDRQPGFDTPTGRVEYFANAYHHFGDDPLPYYSEPPYGPGATPELMDEFPFILTTGARTYASFHSEHRQIETLREIVPDPLLDVNPADAKALGLEDGDWAWIESPFGKCKQRVNVTPTIKPGVVHAMHAWWYPENEGDETNAFDWKTYNVNVTMPHKVNGKMGFGDCFKNMICKVYSAEEAAE